jgi:hypothetical protein
MSSSSSSSLRAPLNVANARRRRSKRQASATTSSRARSSSSATANNVAKRRATPSTLDDFDVIILYHLLLLFISIHSILEFTQFSHFLTMFFCVLLLFLFVLKNRVKKRAARARPFPGEQASQGHATCRNNVARAIGIGYGATRGAMDRVKGLFLSLVFIFFRFVISTQNYSLFCFSLVNI